MRRRELLTGAAALAARIFLILAAFWGIAGSVDFADAAGACGAGSRRVICLSGSNAGGGVAAARKFLANDGAVNPLAVVIQPAVYDAATKLGWLSWQSTDGPNLVVHVSVYNNSDTTYTGFTPNIPPRSWSPIYQPGLMVATTFQATDHGYPSECQDDGGYWHEFFGTWFNAPLQHAVTTNPNDPTAWTQLASIGNGTTESPGYPVCIMVGSTMYLFSQNSLSPGTGQQLWLRTSSSIVNGVVTFNAPVTIGDVGTANEWYPGGYTVVGTDIWFPATRASAAATVGQRDQIYLLRYDTLTGNVRNVDASFSTAAASLPILPASLTSNYLVTDPGASNGGIIATLAFDSSNVPNILYAFGNNATPFFDTFAMRATQFVSGAWQAGVNLGSNTGASFNSATIIQDTDGGVTAYWPQINATLQGLGIQNGGDIATAHKPLGGAWGAVSIVQTAAPSSGPFANPYGPYPLDGGVRVLNGPPEMQIIWDEVISGAVTGSAQFSGRLQLFAHGSNGYLSAPAPFYNAVQTAGLLAKFNPKVSASRATLIDTMLACEVAAGNFSRFQFMYVMANSAAQNASISWVPPGVYSTSVVTNNGFTIHGTPTFTTDKGYQGNGTSDYIDTLLGLSGSQPNIRYLLNSATASAYTLNASSSNGIVIGAGTSGAVNQLLIGYSAATTAFARVNTTNAGSASASVTNQIGLVSGVRTGSTALSIYRNGVSLGTNAAASAGVPFGTLTLLAAQPAGTFSNQAVAEADLGLQMSATQALAHFNCLHPYMQSVAGAP